MAKKSNPKILVMMGNIGVGKTTYARKIAQKGYLYVSRDDIRSMLGGGVYMFDRSLESSVFDVEHYTIATLMDTGKNIIVDEVGVSKELRSQYIELSREYDYTPILCVMPRLKKTECVKRRMADPRGDYDKAAWTGIWEMFESRWEEPDKSEGWSEIVKLTDEEITNGKIRRL